MDFNTSKTSKQFTETDGETRRTIAHLSDLHIGRSRREVQSSEALCAALISSKTDHVIITGDVTDHGRKTEYVEFERIFQPLINAGKLSLVPGNHDRLEENAALQMMDDRLEMSRHDSLFLIKIDSTAKHNHKLFSGHGSVNQETIDRVRILAEEALPTDLVVVALHHHLTPLPEEYISERISSWLGFPFADELRLGIELLQTLQGRCDIILHGHRHVPAEKNSDGERGLRIYNAGSSTELSRFRLFAHDRGKLVGDPLWITTSID